MPYGRVDGIFIPDSFHGESFTTKYSPVFMLSPCLNIFNQLENHVL